MKFLSALRRGNVHGALDMGLTPGFAPGRVVVEGERGLDAAGILTAAAAGRDRHAGVARCRPAVRFPRSRRSVRTALDEVRFVIAVGAFASDVSERANVLPPHVGVG